ncbi:ribonuclease P protein component [Dehalococcoides mccartyi]|nr:ribonuclease P protein component [Dehalococcoides mccartyi]
MSLPTKQRIRRPAEFRTVFSRGRRSSNAFTNVVVLPNDLTHSRVGLAVSKRVGNAVARNLVKRRIRSSFSDMNISAGWDVVITAKPDSADASYSELDQAIQKSLKRAGVRFASPKRGTIV